MSEAELSTLEQIHTAAKNEFLEKGFKSASLRNIVKTVSMTTGAFYGYYKSKEELFDALVGEQYNTFMERFKESQLAFTYLSPEEQRDNMGEISSDCMDWMTDYAYENYDAFKLLLCCSEGTKYVNMVHEMVEIEIEATHAYVDVLKNLGNSTYSIDPQLEHMLVSGMFSAFFELIIHNVPHEKAKNYVRDLRAFYTAGWQIIMGL
ncbi:MAG: TetR/AcrR family transcriptional regulator [Clostridia bacterium]|nr:TetR/AcrR family transcriptional regulator [Clostridia bacterium]